MRILVVGAGAVGGYFGARLAKAGRDVTFLVREKRAEQMRRVGLVVSEPSGSFTITPQLLLAKDVQAKPQTFDLVLLATKAYSLDAAMDDFAPAVGDGTCILPLLNGMRHLDALEARFGKKGVLGGSTRISADLDSEGRVTSMDPTLNDIHFGEIDKQKSERILKIKAALDVEGYEAILEDDIVAFMWNKWTVLSALAGITCLLRASIGEVEAVPGGAETSLAMLAESAAISAANGYPTPPAFLRAVQARVTEKGSDLTASMYRDLTRGNDVESEPIFGDLLRRGAEHHVKAPLLTAAYVMLTAYRAQRERG